MKKSYLWGIIILFVVVVISVFLLLKDEKLSANELFNNINLETEELSITIDKYGENGFESIKFSESEKEKLVKALQSTKFKETNESTGSKDTYSITLKSDKYVSLFVNTDKRILQILNTENNKFYTFENSEFIDLLLGLNQ